ncbi:hypothetical protein [Myxosarcina sp. GI1(2024)]
MNHRRNERSAILPEAPDIVTDVKGDRVIENPNLNILRLKSLKTIRSNSSLLKQN